MLTCNYCESKFGDSQARALVQHLGTHHDVHPPYRLADHSKCTTKPRAARKLPKKPAGFKPFG